MAPSPREHAPIPVAILGATGSVGQRFVELLTNHPWFEIGALCASERSAGRPYREAVHWIQSTPLPKTAGAMLVQPCDPHPALPLHFSALDASVAGPIEEACARAGSVVVSNAKSHRMDPDVPLVVPEVNPDHLELLERQEFGGGAILTNPNCSTIGLVLALQPLVRSFGVERVHVVTLQALSGAGLPGVPSLGILDNAIPWIEGEEEKMEAETRRILGRLENGRVHPAELTVSAACNRVPVLDGHTECVSLSLGRRAEASELIEAWRGFRAEPQELGLPSAPARPTIYLDQPDAPQPRLHRGLERGMAAVIGRLRPCPILDWKFTALSHNTLRGAAGGAILLAELLVARGGLERR